MSQNYDDWKLSTPWEKEKKTFDKNIDYTFYCDDENKLELFTDEVNEAIKDLMKKYEIESNEEIK